MIDLGRSCARHRPLLIDFVDRGEIRPGTGAALAHLDGCSRCTDVIESTMLTITALRRLGDEVAAVEPRADAWPRLRARLSSWRFDRVASSMPLARVVLTVSLAALLVVPIRLTDKPWGQETLDSNDSWTTSAPVSQPSSSPAAVVYSASARRTTDASEPPRHHAADGNPDQDHLSGRWQSSGPEGGAPRAITRTAHRGPVNDRILRARLDLTRFVCSKHSTGQSSKAVQDRPGLVLHAPRLRPPVALLVRGSSAEGAGIRIRTPSGN